MKTLLSYKAMIPSAAITGLVAAGMLLTSQASAQVVNYEWSGPADFESWQNNANWTPDPTDAVAGGYLANSAYNNMTRYDTATINGATVNSGSGTDASFYAANRWALNGLPDKRGSYTAITVQSNAHLTLRNLRVSSVELAGGQTYADGTYVRNGSIDSTSSLTLTSSLRTGSQASDPGNGVTAGVTHDSSTWIIAGSLTTPSFLGEQAPEHAESTGGYILNITGGSMNVTGTFNWNYYGAAVLSTTTTAHVNLSEGGTFTTGTMDSNWTDSDNAYINFLDTASTATFGKTNFENIADVEALITEGHIRAGDAIAGTGDFNIVDNGTTWTVNAISIPEASTTAFSMMAAVVLLTVLRKRNSRR